MASNTAKLLAASICILLAVSVGAIRQICIYFLAHTFPFQITDARGKELTFRLGTYVPAWLSPRFRYGTWLFVAVTSVSAAGLLTAVTSRYVFATTLILRWGFSAGLARISVRWIDEKERREEDELADKLRRHSIARGKVDTAFGAKNVDWLRDLAAGRDLCDRDYAQSMFNRLLQELNGPISHQETLKFPEE